MKQIAYHRPGTLAEARALLEEIPGARYVAGGTDVVVRAKSGVERPAALVSLRGVSELAGIEVGATIRIGALATLEEIGRHPAIRERHPVLQSALGSMGSIQIRNTATLAGNLCNASPCADGAPPLLVCEARLHIIGASGSREVAVRDFFLGPRQTCLAPGEVLASIELDPSPPGARCVFFKKGRVRMDLALVNFAGLLVLGGEVCREVRLVAGAVAPIPLRLDAAEAVLRGAVPTPELVERAAEAAAEEVSPITDLRATAGYRRQLVRVFARRALGSMLGWRSA